MLCPDYKFLGIMKRQFPGVPLLGLTATATLKVLEDVKTILNIPDCLLLRSSFNRPNLYYQVKDTISMLLSNIRDFLPAFKIVLQEAFCTTRSRSPSVCWLAAKLKGGPSQMTNWPRNLSNVLKPQVMSFWEPSALPQARQSSWFCCFFCCLILTLLCMYMCSRRPLM